jgi:chromosome segregation ATPase
MTVKLFDKVSELRERRAVLAAELASTSLDLGDAEARAAVAEVERALKDAAARLAQAERDAVKEARARVAELEIEHADALAAEHRLTAELAENEKRLKAAVAELERERVALKKARGAATQRRLKLGGELQTWRTRAGLEGER